MENNYSFSLIQRRRWSYSAAAHSLYKECGRKRPRTRSWPWGPMLRKLLQAPLDLGSLCLVDLMTPVVWGHNLLAVAQRWLEVRFGLFGSIWVSDFSRAKKANKRGDWRDPVPR